MAKKEEVLLNKNIKFKEVRCVGEDGEQFGIISSFEALKKAEEMGIDLVCLSPNATPPVCKIMDYGKFKYQQEKKAKEARKNQKQIEIKEIKFTTKIATNDLKIKMGRIREFLDKGKHVKVRIVLKGRENYDGARIFEEMKYIFEQISEFGKLEQEPKLEGKFINSIVVPKKN